MQINITTIRKTSFRKEIIYTCKSNTVEKEAFLAREGVQDYLLNTPNLSGYEKHFPYFLRNLGGGIEEILGRVERYSLKSRTSGRP